MKLTSVSWSPTQGWATPLAALPSKVDLVLYFADTDVMELGAGPVQELAAHYAHAPVVGCSSAGEICESTVSTGGLSAMIIEFASTQVRVETVEAVTADQSVTAGEALASRLKADSLRYVMVLSDGLNVNGSKLIEGLRRNLPEHVRASGGLAGDGSRFGRTHVGVGTSVASGRIAAIGFYGDRLQVAYGSSGGWQAFGPTRKITASRGNLLLSLDDQPALTLYKRYLGELASGLPATGLLFPLQLLKGKNETQGVVRTILAVNEADQSLTFAGDVPEGYYARLMKAGCDALVDGAEAAAAQAGTAGAQGDRLALLVSCVGRKLVMKQRVEEEVEAVLSKLGPGVHGTGFYSYGEICPSGLVHSCDFHNQTMTLTVLSERVET